MVFILDVSSSPSSLRASLLLLLSLLLLVFTLALLLFSGVSLARRGTVSRSVRETGVVVRNPRVLLVSGFLMSYDPLVS